jgi:hypothetical protein
VEQELQLGSIFEQAFKRKTAKKTKLSRKKENLESKGEEMFVCMAVLR